MKTSIKCVASISIKLELWSGGYLDISYRKTYMSAQLQATLDDEDTLLWFKRENI